MANDGANRGAAASGEMLKAFGDAEGLIELQRQNARFMAQAGQIVLRAAQDLARRQAEALQATLEELAEAPRDLLDGPNGRMLADLQRQCIRASVRGFVAQVQLGLESAVSTNAATLALLEEQLGSSTEADGSGQPARRPAAERRNAQGGT
jgi:Phasin protein